MMLRNNVPSVTWAQFELCNTDPQTAFENMSRILLTTFSLEEKLFFIQTTTILV